MTLIIQAPYPGLETTTTLPSPNFDDAQSLISQVFVKRSMNGKVYTYKNDLGSKFHFNWSFSLTRAKSIEMRNFFEIYGGQPWLVTDHNGQTIVGYCKTNPLSFVPVQRGVYCASVDIVTLEFEFEGVTTNDFSTQPQ